MNMTKNNDFLTVANPRIRSMAKILVLDGSEPLSKALNLIMNSGTAAIIVKDGAYHGIIDDRHVRQNISDASRVKCENMVVVAPALSEKSSIVDKLNRFLTGHFKALPVVDNMNKPIGLVTRSDLLSDLMAANLVPKISVSSVMQSPAVCVDEKETVGTAKTIMKEKGVSRVVVLRNKLPHALLSTFDFAGFSLSPKKKKARFVIPEIMNVVDNRKVSDLILRETVSTIDENETLQAAAEKMTAKKISSLTVLSDGKIIGVLGAGEIFKNVFELFSEKTGIVISGLPSEDVWRYDDIKDKLGSVLDKFSKVFTMANASVHFKKSKTLYIAKLFVEADSARITVGFEDYDLKTVTNALAAELESVLEKKKSKLKYRKGRNRIGVY